MINGAANMEIIPFTELITDCTKEATKLPKSTYQETGTTAIVDQGQDFIAGYTDESDGIFTKTPAIIFGDHTRVFKYVDFPFFIGADGVKVLKATRKINYKYLYYYFLQAKFPNTGYARHFKWLKELKIPVPSLEEQNNIAAQLDNCTTLIENYKQLLLKYDELIKSRFIEMFNVYEKNDNYIFTLQELIDKKLITYHLDGNHGSYYPRNEEFVSSGIPYIGANCIVNGEIDFTKAKYLTPERANLLKKGIAKDNDVLFANNATVGPTVVLHTKEKKVILSTSLTAYRCNLSEIEPNYLKYYMLSPMFVKQYIGVMKQTTRNQVPITIQRKYSFLIPPIEIQKDFASFVQQIDKSKFTIQQSLEKIDCLFNSLLQEYFDK